MNELQTWDYSASVERVRPMVVSWRNLTVELVDELYRAREELSDRGSWSVVANDTTQPRNWTAYCKDVGLDRMTVHRWLERYVPEERKLLTPEQVEQRKAIETRKKQNHKTAIEKRVKTALNTGERTEDWDDESERLYQSELKRRKKMKEVIREQKEKEERERQRREREQAEKKESSDRFDSFHDTVSGLFDSVAVENEKRKAFKEKIRLSQSGGSDLFIDALMDYLEELPDDNRRLEACGNIIKVCRGIANELERV